MSYFRRRIGSLSLTLLPMCDRTNSYAIKNLHVNTEVVF